MLTTHQAQAALIAHAKNNPITAAAIAALLGNISTTFAQLLYVTNVGTAAKHKHVNIRKVTSANVQLFANISEFTSVYGNAVRKSGAKIATNDQAAVSDFVVSSNYFEHSTCYSLTTHKSTGKEYLYAIYNNAASMYFISGVLATKQQVSEYLTPSSARDLLGSGVTHNATNGIDHTVQVRNIMLGSIVSITACKSILSV